MSVSIILLSPQSQIIFTSLSPPWRSWTARARRRQAGMPRFTPPEIGGANYGGQLPCRREAVPSIKSQECVTLHNSSHFGFSTLLLETKGSYITEAGLRRHVQLLRRSASSSATVAGCGDWRAVPTSSVYVTVICGVMEAITARCSLAVKNS